MPKSVITEDEFNIDIDLDDSDFDDNLGGIDLDESDDILESDIELDDSDDMFESDTNDEFIIFEEDSSFEDFDIHDFDVELENDEVESSDSGIRHEELDIFESDFKEDLEQFEILDDNIEISSQVDEELDSDYQDNDNSKEFDDLDLFDDDLNTSGLSELHGNPQSFDDTIEDEKPTKILNIRLLWVVLCAFIMFIVSSVIGGLCFYKLVFKDNNFSIDVLTRGRSYTIQSIVIDSSVNVQFKDLENNSITTFTHDYSNKDDKYYRMFKYYFKNGDIVLYNEDSNLERKNDNKTIQ